MATIDPEQERRRLAEFYAGQMDGELEKVAGEAYQLTDLARGVLRAELARRGLTPKFIEERPVTVRKEPVSKPGDPPPPDALKEEFSDGDGELELRDMVTLRQFRDLPEALLSKGSLDSAGIESVLVDNNMVRLDWFISNLIGGVKLVVKAEDASDAEEILNQPIPEGFEVPGIGAFEQPRCPACQSLDVTFKELNRPVSYTTAYLNFPIPVYRRAWRCHACKVEWEDDRLPGSDQAST